MKALPQFLITLISIIITGCGSGEPRSPEEQAFIDANNQIRVYKDEAAFGNSAEAKEIAKTFSVTMDAMQKITFFGGSDIHAVTAGNFLTYCQLTSDKVIFLCVVPGLRDYQGEAREALAEIAWATAQLVSPREQMRSNVVVALRGGLLFGPVWSGPPAEEPETKAEGRDALVEYYPDFLNE